MFHHSRGFMAFEYDGPFAHFFELFVHGAVESGAWAAHVLSYWKESQHNENLLFLFYEEMLDDPVAAVRRITDFIGVESDDQKVCVQLT
jgi:Sulfotransferase domain